MPTSYPHMLAPLDLQGKRMKLVSHYAPSDTVLN